MSRVLVAVAALILLASPVWAESVMLPRTVVPHTYHLHLWPNLEKKSFEGRVVIDLEMLQPTSEVILHAADMQITNARLVDGEAARVTLDAHQETAHLNFSGILPAGPHSVQIDYKSKLTDTQQGLYFIDYKTSRGSRRMLATEFEPTDARRMLPCFDEPSWRARFDVTVTLPQRFVAVSNMPIASEEPLPDNEKDVTFQTTPPMSTYLLALVAGELSFLKGTAGDIPIRVVATPEGVEHGRLALEIMQQILPYYQEYFGTRYPLPKLDLIALPLPYGGAMENWGAITFDESILLFDPKSSAQGTREEIAHVVAHEVAHQWFGNLVTMAWWDDLWLNEGFASWMDLKATDHFNPTWKVWERADIGTRHAMDTDGRRTTHPIQQPVNDPAEAASAFDEITYEKGAAVIRMLETYLGEDVFRDGIRRYLAAHMYGNTTSANLWEALEAASSKPVRAIAASWTEQAGVPVVQVQEDGNVLSLRQERFTMGHPATEATLWQIPVVIGHPPAAVASSPILFKDWAMSVTESSFPSVLNFGNSGYYIVQYDAATFKTLLAQAPTWAPMDRLKLLGDTWFLAQADRVPASWYLDLLESLAPTRSEPKDLALLEELLGTFRTLSHLEAGRPQAAAFEAYGRKLFNPLLSRLGWDVRADEPIASTLLRREVIVMLGDLDDPQVVKTAQARFAAFLKNPATLHPDLRPAVIHVVGRHADRQTYEVLRKLVRAARSIEQRAVLFEALESPKDGVLVQQTLKLSLSGEVSSEESTGLVSGVAASEHPDLAWTFARSHLQTFMSKLSTFDRNKFVPGLMRWFTDEKRARELEDLGRTTLGPESEKEVAKAAETIRLQATLRQHLLPQIDKWIALH